MGAIVLVVLVAAGLAAGTSAPSAAPSDSRSLGLFGDLVPVAAAASGLLADIANLGFAVSHPYGYGLYPPWYAPGLGGYYAPEVGYPLQYAPYVPYV